MSASEYEVKVRDFPWGIVGTRHSWGDHEDGSSLSICRVVEAGTSYVRPPLHGPAWKPVADNRQKLLLDWESDPRNVRTLADLGNSLRGQSPPVGDQGAKELEMLDAAATALMQTARELHGAGCGLGLITAANVLIASDDGRVRVELPDLGFRYDGSGIAPTWLERMNLSYGYLWDLKAAHQQERGVVSAEFAPGPDIVTLGRLFTSVLVEWQGKAMPPTEDFPSTCSRGAPVWDVLERAVTGKIATADELEQELVKCPLSDHFRQDPQRALKIKRRRSVVGICAVTAILAAAITAGSWIVTKPSGMEQVGQIPKTDPTSANGKEQLPEPLGPGRPAEELPSPSRMRPLRDAFQAAAAAERAPIVRQLLDPAQLSADPAEQAVERQWRDYLFQEYLANWRARALAVVNQSGGTPSQRHVACRELTALLAELGSIGSTPPELAPVLERHTAASRAVAVQLGAAQR